jgi:hypothetical protein
MTTRPGLPLFMILAFLYCLCCGTPPALWAADEPAEPASSAEEAVRRFLTALSVRGVPKEIECAMLPHPDAAFLWTNAEPLPDDQKAAAERYIKSLELKQLKVGDKVQIPGGKTLVLDEDHVNATRAQVTHDDAPLPFIVVKTQHGWLVNAGPLIDGRRRAAELSKGKASLNGTWTVDADFKAGDAKGVGPFELRPPADYSLKAESDMLVAWEGAVRADSPRAQLMAMVQTVDPPDAPKTGEDAAEQVLSGVQFRNATDGAKPQYDHWTVSGFERGEIGGVSFIRARWAGIRNANSPAKFRGLKMHGVIYVTLDGSRTVTFIAQDFEPYYRESSRACQSAILQMRRTNDN